MDEEKKAAGADAPEDQSSAAARGAKPAPLSVMRRKLGGRPAAKPSWLKSSALADAATSPVPSSESGVPSSESEVPSSESKVSPSSESKVSPSSESKVSPSSESGVSPSSPGEGAPTEVEDGSSVHPDFQKREDIAEAHIFLRQRECRFFDPFIDVEAGGYKWIQLWPGESADTVLREIADAMVVTTTGMPCSEDDLCEYVENLVLTNPRVFVEGVVPQIIAHSVQIKVPVARKPDSLTVGAPAARRLRN